MTPMTHNNGQHGTIILRVHAHLGSNQQLLLVILKTHSIKKYVLVLETWPTPGASEVMDPGGEIYNHNFIKPTQSLTTV